MTSRIMPGVQARRAARRWEFGQPLAHHVHRLAGTIGAEIIASATLSASPVVSSPHSCVASSSHHGGAIASTVRAAAAATSNAGRHPLRPPRPAAPDALPDSAAAAFRQTARTRVRSTATGVMPVRRDGPQIKTRGDVELRSSVRSNSTASQSAGETNCGGLGLYNDLNPDHGLADHSHPSAANAPSSAARPAAHLPLLNHIQQAILHFRRELPLRLIRQRAAPSRCSQ